jgi:subtilase family serine protease
MLRTLKAAAALAVIVTAAAATVTTAAAAAPASPPPASPAHLAGPAASPVTAPYTPVTAVTAPFTPVPACGTPEPGTAACLALVDGGFPARLLTAPAANPGTVTPPAPFTAADLQSAYRLPSALLGARQTIAIVDAYNDPHAAADLAAYRQANGLPACDAAFPCFTQVNQAGAAGPLPPGNANWAVEESTDVDMASAICPNCKIVLVEADNNTLANLGAAENEAVKLGASVIANSYGGPEQGGEATLCRDYYQHPGVAITVASGDGGFGVEIPAACGSVIAVGGTTLYRSATGRGWSQNAWSLEDNQAVSGSQYTGMGPGSGCSAYIPKPAWQPGQLCSNRMVADTSAVADPFTPVAVYDSYGQPGWIAVGGTSVAAQIIGGVYALAGNAATINPGAYLYAHASQLNDVTTGSPVTSTIAGGANGFCGGSYLCTPGPGYDGPTGLGTPDGIGAF